MSNHDALRWKGIIIVYFTGWVDFSFRYSSNLPNERRSKKSWMAASVKVWPSWFNGLLAKLPMMNILMNSAANRKIVYRASQKITFFIQYVKNCIKVQKTTTPANPISKKIVYWGSQKITFFLNNQCETLFFVHHKKCNSISLLMVHTVL